jgi:tight adherence protein C
MTLSVPPAYLIALLVSGAFALLGIWVLVAPESSVRADAPVGVLERVAHQIRDVSQEARTVLSPHSSDPLVIAGVVIGPLIQKGSVWLEKTMGGGADILAESGVGYSPAEHHARRFLSALAGSALGVAAGVAVWLSRPAVPGISAVVMGSIGAVAGVGLFDRFLRKLGAARRQRLSEEFPTVLELLALALAAGESLSGALRRVATRGSGELAVEWSRVLRLVDAGKPLAATLKDSARNLGVEEIQSLTEHLAQALERGAPLAEVVKAHSSDSRLTRLRGIVERAGKAEVWMLIPLVLIILPITVVFAVWPSLQALEFSF